MVQARIQDVQDASARFWSHVEKTDGCWLWNGGLVSGGYGQFSVKQRSIMAHRYSYELHNKAIPQGLGVLHKCDNRRCVNPAHLFTGTNGDNNRDAMAKGRLPKGEKHWRATKPECGARGESVGGAKLNATSVLEIRRLAAQGSSQDEIAAAMAVNQTTVSRVIRRATWAHLSEV